MLAILSTSMGHERIQEETEGEKYLRLLGLDHLADKQIPGRQERVRDFLDICGEEARPTLIEFEYLSPDDPNYGIVRGVLRDRIAQYIEIPLED